MHNRELGFSAQSLNSTCSRSDLRASKIFSAHTANCFSVISHKKNDRDRVDDGVRGDYQRHKLVNPEIHLHVK